MQDISREILPGIKNRHCKECGVPPTIDLTQPHGHFENEHGEQGVMSFDMETGDCRVWMGDCGWEKEIRVEEFRGRIIIRYLKRYPLNEYWANIEGGEPGELLTHEFDDETVRELRSYREQIYGKLTDEEAAMLSNCPVIIRDSEHRPIIQFYETNMKTRDKFLRQRDRQRAKDEREAERVQKKQERQQETDLRRQARELKEQEVKALKDKLDEVRRILKGERSTIEFS